MRITSLQLKDVGPFDDTTIEFPKGTNPELADVYLLVGENGCGKTTALHALANLLGPGMPTHQHQFHRRLRSLSSLALAASDSGERWLALPTTGQAQADQLDVMERASDLGFRNSLTTGPGITYFGPPWDNIPRRGGWARWFPRVQHGANAPARLDWAVFSYAGARSVEDVKISSISEIVEDPLQNALGFAQTANSQRLAQWVANQDFKRLKALDAGQKDRAQQFVDSINRIQTAVCDIIGGDFSFHTTLEDLDVRVQLNGRIVDFYLLPEGVKSIVSWIADLLMRLDRLPWLDDTPAFKRDFLLLLDEIDVHLHPAWQRKILPVVQKLFPNAQIIASTHSPFVVASLRDGAVIELRLGPDGKATALPPRKAPLDMSYSTTLRSLFGIESDFDLETEQKFRAFQETSQRVIKGDRAARAQLEQQAQELQTRGEEIAQLVQFELNQLKRLQGPPAP